MRRVIEVYGGQPPEILNLFRKDPAGWGRCVTMRLTTPQVAIGSRRAMLLNKPEVIEGLCRGERLRLVKSVQDQTVSDEEASDEAEPDPNDAAAVIRAARRKNRNR